LEAASTGGRHYGFDEIAEVTVSSSSPMGNSSEIGNCATLIIPHFIRGLPIFSPISLEVRVARTPAIIGGSALRVY